MREILFKGKTVKGEWAYGLLSHVGNGWYISDEYGNPLAYEVIPSTIGQYAGLTDKNGKKIFEGDILRYINEDGESHYITVVFEECAFLIEGEGITDPDLLTSYGCLGPEVFGNIHDNPELRFKGGST